MNQVELKCNALMDATDSLMMHVISLRREARWVTYGQSAPAREDARLAKAKESVALVVDLLNQWKVGAA